MTDGRAPKMVLVVTMDNCDPTVWGPFDTVAEVRAMFDRVADTWGTRANAHYIGNFAVTVMEPSDPVGVWVQHQYRPPE
jgi:hypothetical protein